MSSSDTARTARLRPGILGVIGVIVLLHAVGWGVLLLVVLPAGIPLGWTAVGPGSAVTTLGIGATAYLLGLRHAFDADHIAAIDNTTRRLLERGKPADTVGFWFALGHSTIVVVLCVLLSLGIAALGSSLADDSSALRTWAGVIGPVVSSTFLLVVAGVGVASLRHRHPTPGLVLRLLGPFERAVDRPSRMYAVGVMFGLGFDTATEIGLLALAGAATVGAVPWWAVLTLPVLFTAGMSACDTAQGAVMRRAYGCRGGGGSGRRYALAMTGISVFAAALIAGVQLSGVLVSVVDVTGPLRWLASIPTDDLGVVLTGALLFTWAIVLVATRRGAPGAAGARRAAD